MPGLYVIGALAGYPLIKHCMNQGYDVVEFINGNKALTPADEKDLAAIFEELPQQKPVSEWLEYLRTRIRIFADVSPLQMREFMLDSKVAFYRQGDIVFEKGEPGSSLFAIADGHAVVEVGPDFTVPIEQGSIFGEVGLISGRKRGATIRAGEDSIFVEVSRTAALKLMAAVPGAQARDQPHLARAPVAPDFQGRADGRGSRTDRRGSRDRACSGGHGRAVRRRRGR